MTNSPAKYRAIPSSEDEAGVGEDEPDSTSERIKVRAKWTYFLLGCALYLPWNALANGTSFFLSRLAGSTFHSTFSSSWTSAYTLAKLAFQFYSTFTLKQSSPSRRIFASISVMILLVTALCLSTFIRGTPPTFFAFVLSNAVSVAVAVSYLYTAVYAGAALLGTSFLHAVLSGQATIGAAVSAVQVVSSLVALWGSSPKSVTDITRASGRDDLAEEIAARIFFGVSAVFLCVTLVAYTWLARQSFYKSATGAVERHCGVEDPDERTRLVADGFRNRSTESNSHIYQVFRHNLIFMFSLAYLFSVTFAIYPALTVRVQPVNPGIHPLLFTAVHFLVFNTAGLVGQSSCSLPCLVVWSRKKILAMALLRTLFIPLLLLCNVDRPAAAPVSPMIRSDILFMIIMLAMGYTHGYVMTLALLAVSSLERNPGLKGREDVDVAATLGGFCTILGLTLGSLSSFGVQAMI